MPGDGGCDGSADGEGEVDGVGEGDGVTEGEGAAVTSAAVSADELPYESEPGNDAITLYKPNPGGAHA